MSGVFDGRTLEALDFSSVRERVVAATRTQRGRTRAESLIPSDEFADVVREQRRTAAMCALCAATGFAVMPAIDTAEPMREASLGRSLAPRELRLIGEALAAAAAAWKAVRADETLRDVTSDYVPLDDLNDAVAQSIDERDTVLDRASPTLSRLRKNIAQAQREARDRMNDLVHSAKYAAVLQEPVVTIRDGRYVVPVKAEFAGELPGIVHDTSASGQTLFVEPLAALESNNQLRTLKIAEEREVERILADLSRRVGENVAAIEANVEMLAALDLLAAKAQVSRAMGGTAVEVADAPLLNVVGGRHPLLGEHAVPQSLHVDDETRILVISGPNMGGKTVALKMAGLFVAMTYAGLQIPAESGSRVGRFTRVVADVGDEQSIAANASTFSAHLDRMREVLAAAGERTLALVDEIGGGTEPSAGSALAIAMLELLLSRRTRAIVTTHANELKLFAHATPGISNAGVRFDLRTFAPTYQLDLGTPAQSLTFALARARGVDGGVVERAERLIDAEESDYERVLEDLAQRRVELNEERQALAAARRAAESERDEAQRRSAELDVERERLLRSAQERLQQSLREFRAGLERRESERRAPRMTAGQAAALAQTLDAMRRDLGISEPDREVRSIRPGIRLSEASTRGEAQRSQVEIKARSSNELDVRGKRYADAEPVVDRWLDDALLAGNSSLRLIHGKGTGALGRGLHAFLRDHPAVASVRYGTEEEGSSGVTIIELR